MKIDVKLIERLENLSMLEVGNKEEMAKNLSEIVEFVEMLNELDTENVDATFNVLNASTPLREDVVKEENIIDEVLAYAPKAKDGYFIVPKIIE